MIALYQRAKVKASNKVVEKIHNEFNTAGDKLLVEARGILAKQATDKGERLAKAGFGKAMEAKAATELQMLKRSKGQVATLIEHYATTYPTCKFITVEAAEKICKKYSLIIGDVSDFKGYVPEENLREIEAFKVNKSDLVAVNAFPSLYQLGDIKVGDKRVSRSSVLDNRETCTHASNTYFVLSGLSIAAPLKDFDIKGKEVRGFYLLKPVPKDPVVLQRVYGGYLVVTAWGIEAEDPIVKQ